MNIVLPLLIVLLALLGAMSSAYSCMQAKDPKVIGVRNHRARLHLAAAVGFVVLMASPVRMICHPPEPGAERLAWAAMLLAVAGLALWSLDVALTHADARRRSLHPMAPMLKGLRIVLLLGVTLAGVPGCGANTQAIFDQKTAAAQALIDKMPPGSLKTKAQADLDVVKSDEAWAVLFENLISVGAATPADVPAGVKVAATQPVK